MKRVVANSPSRAVASVSLSTATSHHTKVPDDALDPLVRPLGLSDDDVQKLVAFLISLTDRETIQGALFLAPDRVPSGLEIPR